MTNEFPDLPSTSPQSQNALTSNTTVLSNGLTVVTEDSSSTSTVTLTFPAAGSSSETNLETGAALANRCLSFKSGSGMSSLRILRTLENEGAVPFSTAGRTSATVGFTVAPEKTVPLLPLLVTECSFEKWDVNDAKHTANIISQEFATNPQLVLTEQLYAAAYGAQSPMGRSFYASAGSVDGIKSFRERNYGIGSAVLSATGVPDHNEFCQAVADSFSNANATASAATEAAYVGGESRVSAPSTGHSHLAIAFESNADTAVRNVVNKCISLSSPDNVSAFTASGIVGLYASTSSEPSALADSIASVLASPLTDDLVARAKKLAKADALFRLDAGSKSLSDAMTESVLESGGFDVGTVVSGYDGVTPAQVSAALAEALKSNPAVAAVGDLSDVPYQPEIKAKFN